jgi:iron(III) transport system ATP-binding protein
MVEHRLRVRNLSVRYDSEPVFEGLDFSVAQGKLLSVMGVSGSGKSTLLRVLSGFMDPFEGHVEIDGRVVASGGGNRVSASQRGVGLMFQNFALFPHMSVGENVAFGIRKERNASVRVAELLSLVQMSGFESRSIDTLSGGQRQRVALVRALAPKPAVLLLDEPFANLDAQIRRPIAQMLKSVLKHEGAAAVMVTHDGADALSLADQIAILEVKDGRPARLSQIGTPEDVYWQPHTETVARLTGRSLILECTAHGDTAESPMGILPIDRPCEGSIRIMIRPDTIRWAHGDDEPFEVEDVYFCGPGYAVAVRCGEHRFELLNVIEPPTVGMPLRFTLTRPAVVLDPHT